MQSDNKIKPWQDRETLRELYVDRQMSQQAIADHFDNEITGQGIKYWLEKHGIENRTRAESARIRHLKECPKIHTDGHLGYERCRDKIDGEASIVLMHRLLAAVDHSLDELRGSVVHHKNNIPWDNRPSNIEVMTRAEHATHHHHK